jgi:molybdopterin converting factor small subunit
MDEEDDEVKIMRIKVAEKVQTAAALTEKAKRAAAEAEIMQKGFATAQRLIEQRSAKKRKTMKELEGRLQSAEESESAAAAELEIAKAAREKVAIAAEKLSRNVSVYLANLVAATPRIASASSSASAPAFVPAAAPRQS